MSADGGQTASEYVGMLLVVSVILATIAASDFGHRLRVETQRQICLLVNAPADCPLSVSERDRRERDRARRAAARDTDHDRVADRLERRYGTDPYSRDTDGDGVDDATEIRRGTAGG